MTTCRISILGLLLCLAGSLAAQDKRAPKALFASDEIINVTIDSNFKTLIGQAKRATEAHPGTLTYGDNSYPITVAARGNSRRQKFCKFPPLRVKFSKKKGEKPKKGSLFRGQKSLKLVTHCQKANGHQQHVLLEYAAYKLQALVTPYHMKVRLAHVTYMQGDRTIIKRLGFFIEDIDHAAKRLDLKKIKMTRVAKKRFNPDAAARAALFQYMISNLDFSMIKTHAGKDCCHNVKLLATGKKVRVGIIPVPYDFDSTGLVDSPYAGPPASVKLRSLRQRFYRGYCQHNDAVLAIIPDFLAQKEAILATFDDIEDLDSSSRRKSVKFLGKFFETISDAEKTQRRLIGKCR